MILLGFTEAQKKALDEEQHQEETTSLAIVDLSKKRVTASERRSLYNDRCCVHGTPRIMMNDLLNHKIDTGLFGGMLIFHTEDISLHSGIEFSVRLFRRGNSKGFVHLISDNPVSFEAGFTKVLSSGVRHLT